MEWLLGRYVELQSVFSATLWHTPASMGPTLTSLTTNMGAPNPLLSWNGMGWDGMEWNGVEWNGMAWKDHKLALGDGTPINGRGTGRLVAIKVYHVK